MSKKDNKFTGYIPDEINTHKKLFGKEMWEVEFELICPVCDQTVDQNGFCSCGAGSD